MNIIPISIKNANEFVKQHHRHSDKTVGGKFAIGCMKNNKLIGVGIGGRPVARALDNGFTFEITRVCTDGTRNAVSFIYDKMRKIALMMGYKKVITYTLVSESGSSLKALSAVIETETKGNRQWNCKSRKRQEKEIYRQKKNRWDLTNIGVI